MQAAGQQIARGDRVSKYFGDLLLETHLLGNWAEGVQTRFRSV